MEHIFVADTNLFFECKRLEDLPWSELGADQVVIALTRPVHAEIDKHKKGGGRTRKRALEVSGRVRKMLESHAQETVIQEEVPRVVLRMVPTVLPDPAQAEALDYNVNDDRIVGIVSALAKHESSASVSLLTDDGGAAATADSLGLNFRLIEDHWKRPLALTDKEKENASLKKELAAYRAQEPSIEVWNATVGPESLHVVRRIPGPLAAATITDLVADLEAAHPMVTDFSVPESKKHADGAEVTYEPPSAEEIEAYQADLYPGWVQRCRSDLERLHEGRGEIEAKVVVIFALRNTGTRPATNLRVTFKARGKVWLKRTSEDAEEVDRPSSTAPRVSQLPKPPAAPTAKRVVKPPPKPLSTKGFDISKVKSFGN